MFGWLLKKLRTASPESLWSVAISDGEIIISDGLGTERRLPVAELKQVVVATDDSGPWDCDVAFLLYSTSPEPVGIFPLGATGAQDFVDWFARLPGYRERELASAMSSTRIAKFVVWDAEP